MMSHIERYSNIIKPLPYFICAHFFTLQSIVWLRQSL